MPTQEARDLIKFLQWGHTSVSKRFLDAAIRFLLDTPSQNLNSLAAVRMLCPPHKKHICLVPARPWQLLQRGPISVSKRFRDAPTPTRSIGHVQRKPRWLASVCHFFLEPLNRGRNSEKACAHR